MRTLTNLPKKIIKYHLSKIVPELEFKKVADRYAEILLVKATEYYVDSVGFKKKKVLKDIEKDLDYEDPYFNISDYENEIDEKYSGEETLKRTYKKDDKTRI